MSTQTKYRIKTSKELANDYTIDYDGDYNVNGTWFNIRTMSHLYGVVLTDSEARQILSLDEDDSVRLDLQNGPADKDNNWSFSRGMITEMETTWAIKVTKGNAAELEAWRVKQHDANLSVAYDLTKAVEDREIVYLLSSHPHDSSYQHWGPIDQADIDQIINLKQWRELTSSQTKTETSMQTISRKNLGLIHDVACSTWKSTIEGWMKEQGVFLDEYTLTEEQVDKMFTASNDIQKMILVKTGLKQSGPAKIDLTKDIIPSPAGILVTVNPLTRNQGGDYMISLRYSTNSKYDRSCYYLSNRFDWTIEQDGDAAVLVPKYKK